MHTKINNEIKSKHMFTNQMQLECLLKKETKTFYWILFPKIITKYQIKSDGLSITLIIYN